VDRSLTTNSERKRSFPRHSARRAVLMAMFAHQLGEESDAAKLEETVRSFDELPDNAREFFRQLLVSAIARENLADAVIAQVADNWEIERISAVDRNILRIGIAELLDFPTISLKVTIDEAIELAKEFGGAQSSKFVNGLLDAAQKKLVEMGLLKKEEAEAAPNCNSQ